MKDDVIEVTLELASVILLRPSHAKTCHEFKKKNTSLGHTINPQGFVGDD